MKPTIIPSAPKVTKIVPTAIVAQEPKKMIVGPTVLGGNSAHKMRDLEVDPKFEHLASMIPVGQSEKVVVDSLVDSYREAQTRIINSSFQLTTSTMSFDVQIISNYFNSVSIELAKGSGSIFSRPRPIHEIVEEIKTSTPTLVSVVQKTISEISSVIEKSSGLILENKNLLRESILMMEFLNQVRQKTDWDRQLVETASLLQKNLAMLESHIASLESGVETLEDWVYVKIPNLMIEISNVSAVASAVQKELILSSIQKAIN